MTDSRSDVRRDHRPYWLKKAAAGFNRFYVRHFLAPQFDALGEGAQFLNPRHIEIIGPNIRAGKHAHINAERAHPVKICVWFSGERLGHIDIGDHVLISPGTRIISSIGISIGSNTMIASGCYLSDSDWHSLYDRTAEQGAAAPIVLEENVWLGVNVIVGKGVRIGRNSVIGAGSVVTRDIPANVVAGGCPATVRKALDPQQPIKLRSDLFADAQGLSRMVDTLDRAFLTRNSFLGWLRSQWFPRRGD
ncbi:MAG: acyltransferase [Alphaproteobacteria bacterium]|nr:acyltransferase [Alphaproteobacteria bacterium]